MRTTMNIDDRLLEEASKATGIKEKSKLLHDGLRAFRPRKRARDNRARRERPGCADSRTTAIPRKMFVVDSSIWIDDVRAGEPLLDAHLMREQALMHPHVLGEVALGSIKNRELVLYRFERLPIRNVAKEGHVLHLIDQQKLWATGIGYTDAHLLASALLTPDGLLFTRDTHLLAKAERLGIAYTP